LKPTTRGEHIAYWISQLGSPPVMGLLALVLTAVTLCLPRIWLWSLMYVALAMGIPLLYIFWRVRKGKITDMDIQLREQRTGPFLVTILAVTLAAAILRVGHAPDPLVLMAYASLVQLCAIFLITLRWKISVHTSTAAGISVLMLRVVGAAAVPLAITVPLIAWSRVKLGRHTLGQTIAGTALGIGVFLTAVLISTLI